MKKFIITSVIALAMSMTCSTADANNYRNISSKQSTYNVAHNNNSDYRNNIDGNRYNNRINANRPRIGSHRKNIHNATIIRDGRENLYLCNGVIYRKVLTRRGYVFEVVSYEIPASWRR